MFANDLSSSLGLLRQIRVFTDTLLLIACDRHVVLNNISVTGKVILENSSFGK